MAIAAARGGLPVDRRRHPRLPRGRDRRRRPLADLAQGAGNRPEQSAASPALFLIGMFYNQFLPGGTGGDIVKSYLLLKETPDKKAGALLAVLFDRMIGLIALDHHHRRPDLSALRLARAARRRRRSLLWILLAVLGSFRARSRHLFRHQRFQSASPAAAPISRTGKADRNLGGLSSLRASLAGDAGRVWHARSSRISATFATFLCVAYAFHAGCAFVTGPIDFFAIMPIERTISSLPISFAGVGLRENSPPGHAAQSCAGVPDRTWRSLDRLDEFPRHPDLLPARRYRLFLLPTERRAPGM